MDKQKQKLYDWERWVFTDMHEESDFSSEVELADFAEYVAKEMKEIFANNKHFKVKNEKSWLPTINCDIKSSRRHSAYYCVGELHFQNYEENEKYLAKYLRNYALRKNFYYKTQNHIYYEREGGKIIQPIHKEEFKECEDWKDKWYDKWCDEEECWDKFTKKYPNAPDKPFVYWDYGDNSNTWVYVPQTKEEWLKDSSSVDGYETNERKIEKMERKLSRLKVKGKRLWNKLIYLHEYAHYLTLWNNVVIFLNSGTEINRKIEPAHGRYFTSLFIWLVTKFGDRDYRADTIEEIKIGDYDTDLKTMYKKKSSFKSEEDEQNFLIKQAKAYELDYSPNFIDILNNK